ncbi:DUF2608 domain-containing protein [Candidatus Dependentiae bacterium]|nr:DUF2608 domain-containing protein [Candidatus Dependentiae bacterium]
MQLTKLIVTQLTGFIIVLCLITPLKASIKQVSSVQQGLIEFNDLNPNDLIVCDIDETLTYYPPLSKQFIKKPLDIQLQQRTFYPLDAELPTVLNDLQRNKKVPVIALSHARTGKFGVIPSMEEWRFNALAQLGFSFSFDEKNHAFLLTQIPKPHPSFFKGIILSAHHAKGPVLLAFLKHRAIAPKRVLFFDDKKSNILSVHKTCSPITQVHCFHITKK